MIEIVAAGPLTTVQDLGRPGHATWGIPRGGAADRGSLRLGNRLVGNTESAAAFEILLGSAQFQFGDAALLAVTGAATLVTVDGAEMAANVPIHVSAGAVVRIPTPVRGLRSYLAVRGGLATAYVLGSRAVDEHSGIGRACRAGDEVAIGADVRGHPLVDVAPQPPWSRDPVPLRAVLGPRDHWFTADAVQRLATERYVVQPESDRVGLRLAGTPLERRNHSEMLSEPTLRGAVEVPTDGLPIVFGAECPTTCGYPVVAVLDSDSADRAAQCRPGQTVTFTLSRPRVHLTATARTVRA